MAGANAIKAGEGFLELFLKTDKLKSGLTAASKSLQKWAAGVGSIGASIMGASATILGPITAAVMQFSESGDAVQKMAVRTGMSAEAVSELGHAAGLSGTNIESLENGLRKMQKTIGDASSGSKSASDALAAIGVSAAELRQLSPDQQFERIADKISAIKDPAMRAAAAMNIFGKSGTQLIPLMADGAAGIQEMRNQAKDLGLTMTTDMAGSAAKLNDALGTMWSSVKALTLNIGAALAPAFTDAADKITAVVSVAVKFIQNNQEMIVMAFKVAGVVALVGAGFVALAGAATVLSYVLIGVKMAMVGVAAVVAFIASPIGIAIAAVTALVAGFIYLTGLSGTLIKAFGGITSALLNGKWGLAGSIMMKSLEIAWISGVLMLKSVWIDFKHWFFGTYDEIADHSKNMWEKIIDQVAVELLGLRGVLQKSFNYRAAIAEIDKDARRRKSSPSSSMQKAANEKNQESARIQKQLDDAKRDLDSLISQANSEAKSKTKRKFEPYDTSTLGPKKLMEPSSMASSGAFSGFAARLLGRAAPSVSERIAKASEETNEKLDELLAAVKDGGLDWAP